MEKTQNMEKVALAKPRLLRLMATFFLLAPIGNIILSLALSGVESWYLPSVLFGKLIQVPLADWAWLLLVFLSGVLLFIQHRTAWLLASVSLMIALFMNFYTYYIQDPGQIQSSDYLGMQVFLSAVVTITALLIVFYSRFPYLDRRTGMFWGAANRMGVRTAVQLVAEDIYLGETESISKSGARVLLQKNLSSGTKIRHVDLLLPDAQNLKIKCLLVGVHDNRVRLKFRDLKDPDRSQFHQWLKNQRPS